MCGFLGWRSLDAGGSAQATERRRTQPGFQLDGVVRSFGGPAIPWWMYALLTLLVVGFLGYRNIDLTAKVLAYILVGEVTIVLVLSAVVLFTGGDSGLTLKPFNPAFALSGNFAVALAFGINSFIGIEAIAVFRDEVRDPDRTVPRAMYTGIGGIALFYALSAYTLIVGFGPDKVLKVANTDPGNMLVDATNRYLGPVGDIITQTFLLTSIFACTLAFQNVLARYIHVMASDGLISARSLSRVHPTHKSPHRASLLVSVLITVVLLLGAAFGLDPVGQMLGWSSALVVMGIMILMVLTSVSVIVYFARQPGRTSPWKTKIAPACAAVMLSVAVVLYIANFPVVAGGSMTLAYILLALIPIAAIVGLVVAVNAKRRQRSTSAVRRLEPRPFMGRPPEACFSGERCS